MFLTGVARNVHWGIPGLSNVGSAPGRQKRIRLGRILEHKLY